MKFKLHSNDAEFRSLMARLKGAGRKANTIMKTSMARSAKPIINDWKREADTHKRTGATLRSLGTYRTKDGIRIGVRFNFTDRKTGKIPNKYAAAANRVQGNWFGGVWESHKNAVTDRMFKELKMQLNKKGF